MSRVADEFDPVLKELESQLEGVERSLSAVEALDQRQAERLGDRMDRLASQLLEVSSPPLLGVAHAEFGVEPAAPADFSALVDGMAPADDEG